jgi:hypothetical protein
MSEEKTYEGSCHCGAVRYEVTLALETAGACNCSMCHRAGTLLTFVAADKFRLKSGEEVLTDYLFNKHIIHHYFCKVCGIKPFARGKGPNGETVAVNVRCLEGVELSQVSIREFDGKSL